MFLVFFPVFGPSPKHFFWCVCVCVGLPNACKATLGDLAAIPKEFLAKLAACFTEKDLSLGSGNSSLSVLKASVVKDAKPEKEKNESKGKDEPQERQTAPESTPGSSAPDANAACTTFQIGMVVITTSGKQKEKFNQQKGKVTKILTNDVVIEMISGPGQGESKKFKKTAVSACEENENKRKAPAPQSSDEAEAKKKRAEALFGAEGLDEFS